MVCTHSGANAATPAPVRTDAGVDPVSVYPARSLVVAMTVKNIHAMVVAGLEGAAVGANHI
jgi:hypothetical protein